MEDASIRQGIIDACLHMNSTGLNQGTSGNISVRHGDGLLITPTGLPYDKMAPEDIVAMDMDGTTHGRNAPSSEWRFHRDILAGDASANAVVHAHPPYCTTLAIMGRSIPPVHYMIAVFGGTDVRCAPYEIYGSEALSSAALTALTDRRACLLAHHGMIVTGRDLDQALWLAVELEALARQYHGALQIGDPPELSTAQMDAVLAKINTYGRRDP